MDSSSLSRKGYAGLFLLTLCTVMYEILLTRIFSVTMWYHFAFVAISVAMFGMSVGAILVYQFPDFFAQERAKLHLALSCLLFSATIVTTFLTHLSIPFVVERSLVGLYAIAFNYAVVSIPFVFSGIAVCLALTRFPSQVSTLYATDLVGASLGCVFVIVILNWMDGPSAVIVAALLACVSAALFARDAGRKKLMQVALLTSVLLATFAGFNAVLARKHLPLLRLMWIKGELQDSPPLFEKWNSFSRITVDGNPTTAGRPFGWGMSPVFPPDRKVRQLMLTIDAGAGTVLTAFDGNLSALDHLKYDVTNVAHYLRPDSDVLVVGAGGGRDLLSALVFGQKSVLGVEINKNILDAVNREFGDFTGHLDQNPKIRIINDEARSYIARSKDRYDIIETSLIDTWAATAAGAFVLSENSLYTVDAWKIFLDHLTPRGLLTFSRWYFGKSPAEVYRLASLATASLARDGIKDPRNHIVIIRRLREEEEDIKGIGTILVSKSPLSVGDLDKLEQIVKQMHFEIVLSPRFSMDSTFAGIESARDVTEFTSHLPFDISPPTDDRPFFFYMIRLRDVFRRDVRNAIGTSTISGWKPVFVLGALLIAMVALTAMCVFIPLMLRTRKRSLSGTTSLFWFFAGIGFGFMFVEISQMQRLIVFLGHPTYGLSVVLFALLLSSGIGSYTTERVTHVGRSGIVRLSLLLLSLVFFGAVTPFIISTFQDAGTSIRIIAAVLTLFPLGVFMGMAFPLGMKLAANKAESITPWLWGINGATSVCASVLAVAIALSEGISTSFWTGVACYGVAVLAFLRAVRAEMR
jgi:hypothetical protein